MSCMVLPLLSLIVIYLIPESPVWLARKGHVERAERALKWLRCNNIMAKNELNDLVARNEMDQLETKSTDNIWTMCAKVAVLKPLVIINAFHVMIILSGTYLIVFYAVDIIAELGADVNSMTAAVYTAIVRLVFCIVSCFMLYLMNRRTMILISAFGSGLSTLTLAIFVYCRLHLPKTPIDLYVAGFCILMYIACTAGFMVMPGVMIGELLPAQVRGRIGGYIFAAFNIGFFAIAKFFPYISQLMKTHGIFVMFGLSSLGAAAIMYFLLPETKGKTLGEIEDYFQENNWLWSNRKSKSKKNINI